MKIWHGWVILKYNISQPLFDSVEHARSSYTDTIGVSTLGHMVEQ